MKYTLFICNQCGARAMQDTDVEDAPPEWATIYYDRCHTTTVNGVIQWGPTTTSTTHACPNCAEGVLQVLKKYEPPAEEKVA